MSSEPNHEEMYLQTIIVLYIFHKISNQTPTFLFLIISKHLSVK